MSQQAFNRVAASIFGVISALHLLRLIFGWEAVLAGWPVPIWLSIVALIAAAYLSWQGWRLGK